MYLEKTNWNEFNYKMLNKLIEEKKNDNNYVVFDWDYTCIYNDTQYNQFVYQIDNLLFKQNPKEFVEVLKYGIEDLEKLTEVTNENGDKLNCKMLIDDIFELYTKLYNEYEGLNGKEKLEEIRKKDYFNDFKCKLYKYTSVAARVSDIDISQVFSTGYKVSEYDKMLENAIDSGLNREIETCEYVSSNSGKSGSVKISYHYGLRLRPEVQNLFKILNENGIETYVCSASHYNNVLFFGNFSKYNYKVKKENIFGRRRIIDENSVITVENDKNYVYTHGSGKTETIIKYIMPKHENKSPILIAGDSDGDFPMMDYFKNEAMLLIFDDKKRVKRNLSRFIEQGNNEIGNENTKIIVQ